MDKKSAATDYEIQAQIASVWQVEQEILDVIHKVCVEHNLRYSLAYGTLLGAVRHKGFIPWDDDIDLMMPREDYDRLLEIWNDAAPAGYLILNGETYGGCYDNFAKIVKDNTTFLQLERDRTRDMHKGIFVDIFPCDRLAPGKISRILQFGACAVNLLYSRGYTSKSGGILEAGEKILLLMPKRFHRSLRNKAQRFVSRWNHCTDSASIFPCTIDEYRKHYAPDLLNSFESMEFNGKMYSCVAKWDEYLRMSYGDYMELPPEKDRVWKHHPILIDFEHNYEDLEL